MTPKWQKAKTSGKELMSIVIQAKNHIRPGRRNLAEQLLRNSRAGSRLVALEYVATHESGFAERARIATAGLQRFT